MLEDPENGHRVFLDTNNEIPETECLSSMEFVENVNWENVRTKIYRTSDNRYFALPDWGLFIESPYQRTGYAYEIIPAFRCKIKRKQ